MVATEGPGIDDDVTFRSMIAFNDSSSSPRQSSIGVKSQSRTANLSAAKTDASLNDFVRNDRCVLLMESLMSLMELPG